MKIELEKSFMVNELDLPEAAILDEIVGATELQDKSPWGYEEKVECIEVELKEVKVKKWVAKE